MDGGMKIQNSNSVGDGTDGTRENQLALSTC